MKISLVSAKVCLLALFSLAQTIILTACGSGGGTSAGGGSALAASNNAVISTIASTVPGNGDVNPYGVAIVENTAGKLTAGDILVSNFNNSANLQGTGTTIVDVAPNGSVSLFAQLDPKTLPGACPGGGGAYHSPCLTSIGVGHRRQFANL